MFTKTLGLKLLPWKCVPSTGGARKSGRAVVQFGPGTPSTRSRGRQVMDGDDGVTTVTNCVQVARFPWQSMAFQMPRQSVWQASRAIQLLLASQTVTLFPQQISHAPGLSKLHAAPHRIVL